VSVKILAIDIEALPARLLDEAKQHLRVDGSYDDNFIKSCIARAISKFQNMSGTTLNATTVLWKPRSGEFIDNAATLPVIPITEFIAEAGEPLTDVTASYAIELKWDGIHGVPIQRLVGAFADGLALTLEAGIPGGPPGPPPDLDITPAVQDIIFRHTAHLFEHREILIPGKEYMAPDLAGDLTWWAPRI
jgi:hypothetical protein